MQRPGRLASRRFSGSHFVSSQFLYVLAIVLAGAGAAAPAAAGQSRVHLVAAIPDCGAILDDCVPACDWRVPDGGWPLAACYNNICYRQAGACEASRIPRPGRSAARTRTTTRDK